MIRFVNIDAGEMPNIRDCHRGVVYSIRKIQEEGEFKVIGRKMVVGHGSGKKFVDVPQDCFDTICSVNNSFEDIKVKLEVSENEQRRLSESKNELIDELEAAIREHKKLEEDLRKATENKHFIHIEDFNRALKNMDPFVRIEKYDSKKEVSEFEGGVLYEDGDGSYLIKSQDWYYGNFELRVLEESTSNFILSLNKRAQALIEQGAAIKEHHAKSMQMFDEMESAYNGAQNTIKQLKKDTQLIEQALENTQKTSEDLKIEKSELEKAMNKLVVKHKDLNAVNGTLEAKNADLEGQVKQLAFQLENQLKIIEQGELHKAALKQSLEIPGEVAPVPEVVKVYSLEELERIKQLLSIQ